VDLRGTGVTSRGSRRARILFACVVVAAACSGKARAADPPPVTAAVDAAMAATQPALDSARLAADVVAVATQPAAALAPADLPPPPPAPAAQAVAAAVQAQPTNVNVSVRVDSPGANGAVSQANTAVSVDIPSPTATAASGQYQPDTGQYQQPAASAQDGQTSAGVPDIPSAAAASPDAAAAPAPSAPTSSGATDDAATWTWNWDWNCQAPPTTPTLAPPSGGSAPTTWIWNWTWDCGAGNAAGTQNTDGIASQYQSPVFQYQPANVNISIRIGSPGDDGPVTQSNLAVSYALGPGFPALPPTTGQAGPPAHAQPGAALPGTVPPGPTQVFGSVGDLFASAAPPGIGAVTAAAAAVDLLVDPSSTGGDPTRRLRHARAGAPGPRAAHRPGFSHAQTEEAPPAAWPAASVQVAEQPSPSSGEPAAAGPASRHGGDRRRHVSNFPFHLPLQLGMETGSASGGVGGSGIGPVAALLAAFGLTLAELLRTLPPAVGARPLRLWGRRLERPG